MKYSCHLRFAVAELQSCRCHTFSSRYLVLHIPGEHIRLIVRIKMTRKKKSENFGGELCEKAIRVSYE